MVRDFSRYALQLYAKESSTERQMEMSLAMIKKPKKDLERFNRVWETHVLAMNDRYAMDL
jgi:acyl-CoA dehydrogenase